MAKFITVTSLIVKILQKEKTPSSFLVIGIENDTQEPTEENTAFIQSNIKIINFQNAMDEKNRVRLRLTNYGMEIEETQRKNFGTDYEKNIILIDPIHGTSEILQGEPPFNLSETTYRSQLIRIQWDAQLIKIAPQGKKTILECSVSPKQPVINCVLKTSDINKKSPT